MLHADVPVFVLFSLQVGMFFGHSAIQCAQAMRLTSVPPDSQCCSFISSGQGAKEFRRNELKWQSQLEIPQQQRTKLLGKVALLLVSSKIGVSVLTNTSLHQAFPLTGSTFS